MTVQNLVNAARAEIGVKESPANSNKCKYTSAYGTVTAWCVIFIWWLFRQLGASELFYDGKKCASCSQLMSWAKSKKQWVTSGYKPGDLLIYDWNGDGKPEHIGVCTAVSGSKLTAIEGNTSLSSDSNGGQVMTRSRNIKNVLGAVRPKFSNDVKASTPSKAVSTVGVTVTLPELSKSKGEKWQIRRAQILLNDQAFRGANGKPLEEDGVWGANTEAAVKGLQKAYKLEVDGIIGAKTWRALVAFG